MPTASSNSNDPRNSLVVPRERLRAVFTPDVIRVLASTRNPSEALQYRLEVLTACGPPVADDIISHRIACLRAQRAAWEVYIEAAFACGLLSGARGADVSSRLTGLDDDGFRSAMAECMLCWFLAARLRLPVDGVAAGRNSKELDMKVLLRQGVVGVEVKAPLRERPPSGQAWYGDDADKIQECLRASEQQFGKNQANILVIVPQLRIPMYLHRAALVRATYGESVIVFDMNKGEGRLINRRVKFSPRGKFLNRVRPGGKPLKRDGFPAYRRVSAIVSIEEHDHYTASGIVITHKALVLHNPFAYSTAPETMWAEFPQLVRRGNHMEWTDGRATIV